MRFAYIEKIKTLLQKLRIKPLSLAEKCRLQFGIAILFCLFIALLVPYLWMGKLTEKNGLDAGRALARLVLERHFQMPAPSEKGLPTLDESGMVSTEPQPTLVHWIRISETDKTIAGLDRSGREKLEELREDDEAVSDIAWIENTPGLFPRNQYLRLVRAGESCLRCHNPQGSAAAFNKNQQIGVIAVQYSSRELTRTVFLNRLWIILAGLLAATGAIIAFYAITQRVILRPVRQLRALVNNIAEGNYEVRSAIKTGDEYERLSDAFNRMLDNLIEAQTKLQHANQQLDAKISQLSEKNIELFKANKLKSEFLANMSHEFRTPLNAILGFAELLREKPAADVEKSKRYAENIVASGRSLLMMINDLLDLAKAEAGKMILHIEKTSIQQLCEGLEAFFSPMTEKKRLKFRVQVDENIPLVQTDAGKVQQILYNLLSNAIKFTPEEGRIQVQASMPYDNTVRISVSDTGPGISKADQERIFEKFRQLDGSITRTTEGTGLGLAICKQLADLLAGTISLATESGKGSVFSLDIPVNLTAPQQQDIRETS